MPGGTTAEGVLLVNPDRAALTAALADCYRRAGNTPDFALSQAKSDAAHAATFGSYGIGGRGDVTYVFMMRSGRKVFRVFPLSQRQVLGPLIAALIEGPDDARQPAAYSA